MVRIRNTQTGQEVRQHVPQAPVQQAAPERAYPARLCHQLEVRQIDERVLLDAGRILRVGHDHAMRSGAENAVPSPGLPELSGGSLPFGVIFRTASADASEEEIRQEYLELSEKLARIVQYGTMRSLYSCLYRASDAVPELVKRYAPSVSELVTDDRETYEICREYLERHDFHDCRLTWYEDQLTTLTKKENLENHVKQALDKRVDLPSGGFLVIEPTEALTAIDVNSGKQLGGRKNTFLYSVNQEAAREIARQIRLRGISGLILVDFINMPEKEQEERLLGFLQGLVREDPVPTKVVDMTVLHLVELTRKKIRRPLAEQMK